MEGEKVICAFTLHMDIRRGDEELVKEILLRGLHRMEGEYETDAGPVEIGVRVELADKFERAGGGQDPRCAQMVQPKAECEPCLSGNTAKGSA